jgi:cytochrome c oxidase subunit I
VAHFHYTMMGGVLVAFLGGLHYWWPKMTGRMYSEFWGRLAALIVFLGFNLTFFPQFIIGTQGMVRRVYTYKDYYHTGHSLSTIGAYLTAVGLFMVLVYLLVSLFRGRRAPANPWGAVTLDWQCASPPPHDNFATQPVVGDPYDVHQVVYDPESDSYVPRASRTEP